MDKLVVFTPNQVKVEEGDENVTRIEASSILQPGTYWRCVKEPSKPSTHDSRYVWRADYAKDEMLLLVDVKSDENGYAHNVELLLTPERQGSSSSRPQIVKLMVDHFHDEFELVENGEEIRRKQTNDETQKLMGVQQDIVDIQTNPQRLMQELQETNDADLLKTKERLSKIKALPSPEAGTDLVSLGDAMDAKQQLEAKVEIAQATAAVLDKVNQKLTGQIQVIGNYHGEVGQLAVARTKEARELVERVNTALASLDIYLGNDVDVEMIREGQSGKAHDKFKLYQDMLFMDEESLIHAGSGGADHADIGCFFELLASDDDLVERIFPFERCIVIMRPRREDKHYEGAHPFEVARRNKLNRLSFMLIRNGENIHAVLHPMGFMTQLFPSQEEMEESFRTGGFDCRNVTKDDLEYTSSLSKAEQLSRQYKRVVLMLQGIYERDESGNVFGEVPVEGQLQLLNPLHQAAMFDFVSMEHVVEDTRMPSYEDWFESLNSDMRIGSLVFLAYGYIDSDNTPGAFTRGEYSSCIYKLEDKEEFYGQPHVLKKHGQKIGIKVPFRYDGWGDGKDKQLVISVSPENDGVIDLEKVRAEDIDHYLNSRRERKSYARYIPVLQKLKAFSLKEEARTKEMRNAVSTILQDSGRVADEALIFQAVMKYRANNGGKFSEQAHNKQAEIEKVLNVYWQITGGASEMVEKIKDALPENVIAIVSDANNVMYAFTENDTRAREWDETGFKWLSRYKLENTDTMRFSEPSAARITDIRGKMTYLYRAENFDAIEKIQSTAHERTMRQIKNWEKKTQEVVTEGEHEFFETMDRMLSGENTYENFGRLCDGFKRMNDELHDRVVIRSGKRKIHLPIVCIALGTAVMASGHQYALRASVNAKTVIKYFAVNGPDDERDIWIKRGKEAIRYMGNDSQAKEVGDDMTSFGTGNVFASKLEDTNFGVVSNFYENTSKDTEYYLNKGERVSSWYSILYLGQMSQVFGIETFINRYPALSKTLVTRSETEATSLYDLRSEIEREKLLDQQREADKKRG